MSIAEDPEKTAEIDAQAAKLRELVAKRGPACPETKRRAVAILSATLAGSVVVPVTPPPAPSPAPAVIARVAKLCALLAAGLLFLFLSGCVPVEAIQQAEREAAIAHRYAELQTLPDETRKIGKAEERAWRAQYRALVGEDVPMAVTQGWDPLEPEAPR